MSLKDSSGRKSSHGPNFEKYIQLLTLPGWIRSQNCESTLILKQQITVWLKDQISGKKKRFKDGILGRSSEEEAWDDLPRMGIAREDIFVPLLITEGYPEQRQFSDIT